MTVRIPVSTGLGLALVTFAAGQEPAAPKAPVASVREAIFFGPAGPVRVRLNVSIDGRPADAVWNDAVNAVFDHCDRNGDGVLEPAERTAFTTPAATKGRDVEVFMTVGRPPPESLRLSFNPKDEKVSRAAFAEAVRTAGQAAIGLRVVPGRADSRRLSEALFRNLDRNGDGRLSTEELKAARERLTVLDVDEDEFWTAAELLGRGVAANPNRVRPPIVPGMRRPEEQGDPSTGLIFLATEGPAAVKQLLTARGGVRAAAMKPAEFGGHAKAFAALDQDGNGALDTTELTAWLAKPPDLDLAVAFDAAGGRLSSASHPADKAGVIAAALPGSRFRFESPADHPVKPWGETAGRLREQFKGRGKGGNPVERKHVENDPVAVAFFDLADRNADGKVDTAEVEAALKALAPLAACRVDVAFQDRGNGLFELFDRNEDGRLSPRELVEAVAVLKPFAAPDGSVGPMDLVRQFRVAVAAESVPLGVVIPPGQTRPATSPSRAAAPPTWFTKMDRNDDGDVSLWEFVGPLEVFRKLDRDGDGLISPAEALAAEK